MAGAISGLLVMLTLSPCELFLPVYLSGWQFAGGICDPQPDPRRGHARGMAGITWLTLVGMERFPLQKFERYEPHARRDFTVLGSVVVFESGN